MMQPRIAIIVPTPDREREMTRHCLQAIEKTTSHLNVVVEVVVSFGPEFRFARSVNRGMRAHPDADAWVLLNDDCQMEPGWLDAMLRTAAAKPAAGLVGAVLRYPSGRLQHAGGYIPSRTRFLAGSLLRFAPLWGCRRLLKGPAALCYHYGELPGNRRLDFVTAACLFITGPCRNSLGDFDEDYAFGLEDVDYCLRALEAGFDLALATGARGIHLERATGPRTGPLVASSEKTFNDRWSWRRILRATRRARMLAPA